jgi:probable HAF family extracellular repeat protein
VVGWSNTSMGGGHAVVWDHGRITDLGLLPGAAYDSSSAEGINDRGQIVGNSYASNGRIQAVLWDHGRITDLGTLPNDQLSDASGINSRGQIVGWSTQPNFAVPRYAVVWDKGRAASLADLPNSRPRSFAAAINGKGQVVGNTYISDGIEHAVIWDNDRITDLGTLRAGTAEDSLLSSAATGINERGQIVGWSDNGSGSRHAVLWQPKH